MTSKPSDLAVKRGDRRDEVWVEADEAQLTKVRHTWPPKVSGEGKDTPPTDVAVVPEEPSAWEALEDED